MYKTPLKFRFDENVSLPTNSLVEAWLEIQWKLEETGLPNIMKDPNFDIALGAFYQNVKTRFPERKNLDASRIPQDMTPHIVRYQFRQADEAFPVVQLGPGVASVNFTSSYTWDDFKQEALFLREKLTVSYDQQLTTEAFILRYRNVVPFSYSANDIAQFLSSHLNISMQWPDSIPGDAGETKAPATINFALSFNLKDNLGRGKLTVGSGIRSEPSETKSEVASMEVVLFDLEVASSKDNPPSLYNVPEFDSWLTNAHRIIHDWYLSLIDGLLRQQFEGK